MRIRRENHDAILIITTRHLIIMSRQYFHLCSNTIITMRIRRENHDAILIITMRHLCSNTIIMNAILITTKRHLCSNTSVMMRI